LLAEVESITTAGCERRMTTNGISAQLPTAQARLPELQRLVGMDWSLCAWCGKDFERGRRGASRRCPTAVT